MFREEKTKCPDGVNEMGGIYLRRLAASLLDPQPSWTINRVRNWIVNENGVTIRSIRAVGEDVEILCERSEEEFVSAFGLPRG